MKTIKSAFWILALVLISEASFAVSFSFRVQCSKNGNPDLLEVYNKIPERQSYILPTGSTMYFSGAYYNNYDSAKERLDEVHDLGISSAFIRVFKSSRFLSREVSEVLLRELLAKRESDRVQEKGREIAMGKSKLRTMSRSELIAHRSKNKVKDLRVDYKDIKAPVDQESSLSSSADRSGKLKVKELESTYDVNVTEAPVFKILIGKTTGNQELPDIVGALDELVYENKVGNNNYFTVGFYSSKGEGDKALNEYHNNADNNHFKVIAFYRGKLISSELAEKLKRSFESQQTSK